jgi:biopolymer transport protein ExbD
MRVRNVLRYGEQTIELQMAPMIDIVFLLLVFFLWNFNPSDPEGDFSIKMPMAAVSTGMPAESSLPLTVTLQADRDGELSGILLVQRPLRNFAELNREIRGAVSESTGPASLETGELEVELDCEFQLRFEYVIDAISAVSGYVTDDGRIVNLVEKIRFSPPQTP